MPLELSKELIRCERLVHHPVMAINDQNDKYDNNDDIITDEPLTDYEFESIIRMHERAMVLAKQDATLAGMIRNFMSVLDPTVRHVLDGKTSEEKVQRREAVNKKLIGLRQELEKPNWKINGFKASVTILLQEEQADIDTECSHGNTLLSGFCMGPELTETISDSDQYEAIMF
jgi:hypothetical protein